MKKNILTAVILSISMIAAGCAMVPRPDTAIVVIEETAEPAEAAETAELQEEVVYAIPENDMGLKNAAVDELSAMAENAETFYLYIYGGETVPYDHGAIGEGIGDVINYHEFPADFYYVDLTLLSDAEYAELAQVLAVEETVLADGVSTYAGLYAFENGRVKNTEYALVPEGEETNIANRVVSFVFESDLFVNDHGWELVTYEQLCEKRDSGEKFMVYIGRDTCPYCVPFAKALMSALDAEPANVPVYYFYTQPYKTAINRSEEGAQEEWDGVKAELGFQFTPSLLVFEGGEQIQACESGVESDYFKMTLEEKDAECAALAEEVRLWLMEHGLTGETA